MNLEIMKKASEFLEKNETIINNVLSKCGDRENLCLLIIENTQNHRPFLLLALKIAKDVNFDPISENDQFEKSSHIVLLSTVATVVNYIDMKYNNVNDEWLNSLKLEIPNTFIKYVYLSDNAYSIAILDKNPNFEMVISDVEDGN